MNPPVVRELGSGWRRQALVVFQLARQDFHNRYVGSMLGLAWSVVQPLVMTLILWAVFSLAFRTRTVAGAPFVLWLLAGLAAWNGFAEGLGMATGACHEYAYLVKKVRFNVAVLPLVKILSALAAHGLFLLIVMAILLLRGAPPSWYWLQLPYYLLGLAVLLQGLGWLTSALNVFARDVGHAVGVLLQFGFWLTPVFWDPGMFGAAWRPWLTVALRLHPLAYLVTGYRRSLILGVPCWADLPGALCFWGLALAILALGALVFRRLRPHFADVL